MARAVSDEMKAAVKLCTQGGRTLFEAAREAGVGPTNLRKRLQHDGHTFTEGLPLPRGPKGCRPGWVKPDADGPDHNRERARKAVLRAGLPLYRKHVDQAMRFLDFGWSVARVANRLKGHSQ